VAVVALIGGCGWVADRLLVRRAIEEARDAGRHRLELYASNLEGQTAVYAYLPSVVGLNGDVLRFLADPSDAGLASRVNAYLKALNGRAGTQQVYLINPAGTVVASSNWDQADSFVGRDLSYRPYVREARADSVSRYFGIGTTDNVPGYYLGLALRQGDAALGVAAVKMGMDQLEKTWLATESPVIVTDDNGVIVLSSVPAWRYRTVRPLDRRTLDLLDASQQYNRRPLLPVGWRVVEDLGDGDGIVEAAPVADAAGMTGPMLAVSQAFPGMPWRLTVFSDLAAPVDLARTRAMVVMVALALALALLSVQWVHRRTIRERLAAREALQRANDELEDKVARRSAELTAANERLTHEVAERIQAAQTLSRMQAELIRTGNLAVIGQLSASVAHELNQPLAALATLSDNAVRFLDRNDSETVRGNLQRIVHLVQRMGALTGQLRSFARPSAGDVETVGVARCIDNAIALLGHSRRDHGVAIVAEPPPDDVLVRLDGVRFEQVLVNLISNAIDACRDRSEAKVTVAWSGDGRRVTIGVADNGPGLADEVLPHVFEPFFTTKKGGGGLGLGLAISADIVSQFEGTLSAGNGPGGGALFRVSLPQVVEGE
jgi:two-component system C4-dicarboxylate transport sensor histidine kinase DctB